MLFSRQSFSAKVRSPVDNLCLAIPVRIFSKSTISSGFVGLAPVQFPIIQLFFVWFYWHSRLFRWFFFETNADNWVIYLHTRKQSLIDPETLWQVSWIPSFGKRRSKMTNFFFSLLCTNRFFAFGKKWTEDSSSKASQQSGFLLIFSWSWLLWNVPVVFRWWRNKGYRGVQRKDKLMCTSSKIELTNVQWRFCFCENESRRSAGNTSGSSGSSQAASCIDSTAALLACSVWRMKLPLVFKQKNLLKKCPLLFKLSIFTMICFILLEKNLF